MTSAIETRLHEILEDNRKARMAAAGRISRLSEILQAASTPEEFTAHIQELLSDPLGTADSGPADEPDAGAEATVASG